MGRFGSFKQSQQYCHIRSKLNLCKFGRIKLMERYMYSLEFFYRSNFITKLNNEYDGIEKRKKKNLTRP